MIRILSINLDKIEEKRIFNGKKGRYLELILKPNYGGLDQYGNAGMIIHSVSKEERALNVRGAIVGNYREIGGDEPPVPADQRAAAKRVIEPPPQKSGSLPENDDTDLPF